MTLVEIDALLAEWDARLSQVDDSLVTLEGDATLQLLSAAFASAVSTSGASLSGTTRAQVEPALAAFDTLLDHRTRLGALLDRAKSLRAKASGFSLFGDKEQARAIEALLTEKSIELEPTQRRLSERALIERTSVSEMISANALLDRMTEAFAKVRDVVVNVAAANDRLDAEMTAIEARIEAARKRSRALDAIEPTREDLVVVGGLLDGARRSVSSDPLGVVGTLDRGIGARLSLVEAHLDALEARTIHVGREIERAGRLLTRLRQASGDAREAIAKARARCHEAKSLAEPSDEVSVASLGPWLTTLTSKVAERHWPSAEVGLARWFEEAGRLLTHDAQLRDEATALTCRDDELRGRLSARCAQLRARARTTPNADSDLDTLVAETERILTERPTSATRLETMLDAIEGRL